VTSNNSSKIVRNGPVGGGRQPASSTQLTITLASRMIQYTVSAIQISRMKGFAAQIIGWEG
jgi:hypothetical protein